MPDVFISYAIKDKDRAEIIAQSLKNRGIDVWLDKTDISPGENWNDQISSAIRNSENFIAIISKGSRKSNYFTSEIATAIAMHSVDPRRRIFPLIFDNDAEIPSFIDKFQYIDFNNKSGYVENINKLVKAIKAPKRDVDIEKRASVLAQISESAIKEIEHTEKRNLEYISHVQEKRHAIAKMVGVTAISFGVAAAVAVALALSSSEVSKSIIISLIVPVIVSIFSSYIGFYFGKNSEPNSTSKKVEGIKIE